MFNTREKKERSLGTKLFLKAYRCSSAKCATVRRQTRPGAHGATRRGTKSEYGQQLDEKQKMRFTYGLRESKMRRVFETASKKEGITGDMIVQLLERRLDNTIFRLGLAPSRSVARQIINHGHILVNDKRVRISSYLTKIGDKFSIRLQSKDYPMFKELSNTLKKYDTPTWLLLDAEKMEGKMVALPVDIDLTFNVNMIVDFYSK
ncbi:30S ribosomal protein S4 [Patescibacteria group bacterium]|nr:30S ribosomal protein S4 [Patescibacteria group bacterium]